VRGGGKSRRSQEGGKKHRLAEKTQGARHLRRGKARKKNVGEKDRKASLLMNGGSGRQQWERRGIPNKSFPKAQVLTIEGGPANYGKKKGSV